MTLKLRSVKRKGSSMAKEGAAQGIDDLLDDVPEEVVEEQPVEEAPVETPAEEKPAEEVTEEEVVETESQVEKLFEKPDHLGEMAPVSEVVKQRKLKQEAIARAEAAEAQLAQKVDLSAIDELSKLASGNEDEYVDPKTLKAVVDKLPAAIAQIAQKTTNEALGNVQMQGIAAKAKADEAAFKKENPDYDTIVGFAARHKLLSQEELKEVFASGNIAETYYTKAKAAVEMERAALGVAPSKPTTEIDNPPDGPVVDGEGFDNDDEAFDAFMTGGS
jgi:hypothetical protein